MARKILFSHLLSVSFTIREEQMIEGTALKDDVNIGCCFFLVVVVLSEAKRKETTVLSRVVYKNKQRFREWPPYGCSIPCRSRPRCTCRMRGHEAASWTLPSTSRPGGRLLKSRSASQSKELGRGPSGIVSTFWRKVSPYRWQRSNEAVQMTIILIEEWFVSNYRTSFCLFMTKILNKTTLGK